MQLLLHTQTVFSSAHFLREYEGLCRNVHGHEWLVELWISGDSSKKDEIGILFDFGKIKTLKDYVDHKLINDQPPFTRINPTAENLSEWAYDFFKEKDPDLMFKVRVYETTIEKKTWCECGDF
jgi:6-pyruvoyltetrahydropterin/6-carboxytetrahydropterin synthase